MSGLSSLVQFCHFLHHALFNKLCIPGCGVLYPKLQVPRFFWKKIKKIMDVGNDVFYQYSIFNSKWQKYGWKSKIGNLQNVRFFHFVWPKNKLFDSTFCTLINTSLLTSRILSKRATCSPSYICIFRCICKWLLQYLWEEETISDYHLQVSYFQELLLATVVKFCCRVDIVWLFDEEVWLLDFSTLLYSMVRKQCCF
jgi:hypothetical protein